MHLKISTSIDSLQCGFRFGIDLKQFFCINYAVANCQQFCEFPEAHFLLHTPPSQKQTSAMDHDTPRHDDTKNASESPLKDYERKRKTCSTAAAVAATHSDTTVEENNKSAPTATAQEPIYDRPAKAPRKDHPLMGCKTCNQVPCYCALC